ncbi:MAG TPA: potassium-transporting ATPase subunit C [Acidimicrobiales bacterium]|nr:potassium-transporting ATPase subunit C [Acidimicrobiales bacterium]
MLVHLRRSVILAVVSLVLVFGYAYAGTGVSHILFTHQADGSITATGSTLIGQNWSATKCPGHPIGSCVFQGRPDDLGPYAANSKFTPPAAGGDNPLVANGNSGQSGASNLGPRSKVLLQNTQTLAAYWHRRGVSPTPDLVTTSGSGYDPDISQLDAMVQIPMVSAATGLSSSVLKHLVVRETQGSELGFLGTAYINVLELNEALAKLEG